MNVFPIQAPEGVESKCPNCTAAVAADQRYCLTCGQPCSPVRLAFLDVLQAEGARGPDSVFSPPAGYLPPVGYLSPAREDGVVGWLRRYSGLFGLLAVLLVTGLIGLLVGHWMSPSKAAGPQVFKIEGAVLPAAGSIAAGTSTTATASPSTATNTTSKAATQAQEKKEVKEVKEVKEAESPKAKVPPPVKTSSSSLKKLEKLTGKKHQQAIESLTAGGKPIETGG